MNEEKKKENHIKLIIFVVIIITILVLNHIFGWSKYIGNINNLKMLDDMVDNNLPVALAIYVGLTIVGCVVLALPGITFAIAAGLLFGPGARNNRMFRSNNDWCDACIYCRKIFPERQYQTGSYEEQIFEKMVI